jgi:hypothetical protein
LCPLDTVDPRTELERLQQELSTRQSISYFARSAISLVLSLIVGGAAAKLFWDGTQVPLFGLTASTVALSLGCWSVHCYRRGSALLKIELERFERMQGLRQTLGLDDPSTLLPGR